MDFQILHLVSYDHFVFDVKKTFFQITNNIQTFKMHFSTLFLFLVIGKLTVEIIKYNNQTWYLYNNAMYLRINIVNVVIFFFTFFK